MQNPYKGQPDYTFWSRAVERCYPDEVDIVTNVPFRIGANSRVATSGSCFAQHISRSIAKQGFNYLVTENSPATSGSTDENYGVYSARFGNIYTARQLLQLFDRAYGLYEPLHPAWISKIPGRFIDQFRPAIQQAGFSSIEEVEADRKAHLRSVREMFEKVDIFVFTLGLTECWVEQKIGEAYPLAPGVAGKPIDDAVFCVPRNFRCGEIVADMEVFLTKLKIVNPSVKVILTVSPVPLAATFEDRHVLVSTVASKSILRAAVEEIVSGKDWITYFPSYELVTSVHAEDPFSTDRRTVKPEVVAKVMEMFSRHFLTTGDADQPHQGARINSETKTKIKEDDENRLLEIDRVVCDEELIVAGT